mmetsp:Transcript_19462/g.58651  ORF Transcript_19462/g.58651 Transcript_19462/m.58651 type:complete len:329 (-) Transcript_19462:356-1342(-)
MQLRVSSMQDVRSIIVAGFLFADPLPVPVAALGCRKVVANSQHLAQGPPDGCLQGVLAIHSRLPLVVLVIHAEDFHEPRGGELPRAGARDNVWHTDALATPAGRVCLVTQDAMGLVLALLRRRGVSPASCHAHVIELPHAEALEGEEAFCRHVQDCEADLVDLRVLDDPIALPRQKPPDGKAEPRDPHQGDEKSVLLGKVEILVPAVDSIHYHEEGEDEDPEDADPGQGGEHHKELAGRSKDIEIPRLQEHRGVPVPDGHPEQRRSVPARQRDQGEREAEEREDAVARNDRREHDHELQLRHGARQRVADVSHTIDVSNTQPARDAQC